MSRLASILAVAALAMSGAVPVMAADWSTGEDDWIEIEYTETCGDGGFRGGFEPKDWSGLGDECDPLTFEFGTRYWYSWGAHRMTAAGDSYTQNDTSHILELHARIDDHSSDVYVKGFAGHSAIVNSSYTTPTVPAGSAQAGRVLYAGGDIGYMPFGTDGARFGGFLGYQYWNDSPDMGREDFGTGSLPNDINHNVFKLGLAGRLELEGIGDITAEVAAIPYAQIWGTYGAFAAPGGSGNLTAPGNVSGWLYGASGEVMARFQPLENWTVGIGGRAWYLTGEPDVTFSTDFGGGTNWITKATQYSTLRYGLLGEVSYKF